MKKLLISLLTLILTISCINLVACSGGEQGSNPSKIEQAYNLYVVYAQENDITALTYEEWLGSIKGEKGDQGPKGDTGLGIKSASINANGELIIVWTDDTQTNCGKVEMQQQNPQQLAFYPKDDNTFGVSVGNAILLSHIEIPASYNGKAVTEIIEDGFYSLENLTSITIPNTIVVFQSRALCYIENLTTINYSGTKAEWEAISKGPIWNDSTGNYTIHCTDGDIAKS